VGRDLEFARRRRRNFAILGAHAITPRQFALGVWMTGNMAGSAFSDY